MDWTGIVHWTASGCGMIAAVMVASNLGAKLTGWGLVLFAVASAFWIEAGRMDGKPSLAIQNAVLCAINGFGAWRYLVWKKKPAETEAA